MAITVENLDEIFEYHQWSPEQVEKGQAIRAAAKKSVRAFFACREALSEMRDAIVHSTAENPPANETLADYASERRKTALARLDRVLPTEDTIQELGAMFNEIVMVANSAITFEASRFEPIAPELAHTERIEATV